MSGMTKENGEHMSGQSFRDRFLATGLMTGVSLVVSTAHAQSAPGPTTTSEGVTEVVITGSRIPQTDREGPSPTVVIDANSLAERGFVQVGQALNESTA